MSLWWWLFVKGWKEPYRQTSCPLHGVIGMSRFHPTAQEPPSKCPLCDLPTEVEIIEPPASQRVT